MDNQDTPQVQTASGENTDAFVQHIVQWHKQGLKLAEHAFTIPEGFSAMYTEEGKKPKRVVLTGDKLRAFRMGAMAAVQGLQQLPFVYSVSETPEAANDEPAPND